MSDSYAELSVHRWMVRDEVRNEAYRQAITAAVQPGQVVLDMGAGTGILSIFAAKAGARKVYAVERTAIAAVARRMVKSNGVEAQVEVIQGDLEDIDLPEKVDLITSEWMGGLGVDENMLAPLIIARNRWLKPGGKIVPERVTAFLAPLWIADVDTELRYWRAGRHGLDLSTFAALTAHEPIVTMSPIAADDLLAAPQAMWSHDAYTCSLAEADGTFASKLRFEAARTGKLSALATWFSADMFGEQVLATGPGTPETHWGRLVFPLEQTVEVAQGTALEVEFRCEPVAPGSCEFYWSVKIGDGAVEEHDSRKSRAR